MNIFRALSNFPVYFILNIRQCTMYLVLDLRVTWLHSEHKSRDKDEINLEENSPQYHKTNLVLSYDELYVYIPACVCVCVNFNILSLFAKLCAPSCQKQQPHILLPKVLPKVVFWKGLQRWTRFAQFIPKVGFVSRFVWISASFLPDQKRVKSIFLSSIACRWRDIAQPGIFSINSEADLKLPKCRQSRTCRAIRINRLFSSSFARLVISKILLFFAL